MNLDIVLPVRDRAEPEGAGRPESPPDPQSPNFRHYITPAQFTERFGPTQADYDTVVSYMEERGLKVVGGSRDGMEVQVQGTVDKVEQAFHVTMRNYKHPTENRVFFSPDREPIGDMAVKLHGACPAWTISPSRTRSTSSAATWRRPTASRRRRW